MREPEPGLWRSLLAVRLYAVLVGLVAAVGLVAGAATAAFIPPRVTSTAVLLQQSVPGTTVPFVIVARDPALAGGQSIMIPAKDTSVPAKDTSVPASGASVPASGASVPASGTSVPASGGSVPASGTSVPAISVGTPPGQVQVQGPAGSTVTVVVPSAGIVSGPAPLTQVLIGAIIGLACGALTGVIAVLAIRRPARGQLPAA